MIGSLGDSSSIGFSVSYQGERAFYLRRPRPFAAKLSYSAFSTKIISPGLALSAASFRLGVRRKAQMFCSELRNDKAQAESRQIVLPREATIYGHENIKRLLGERKERGIFAR